MAKEMITVLLVDGQGSRLYASTQKLAKPAVPFGGKYRIIDLPPSNCVNSGIDTVGILTQYQSLTLNEYIGNGQPWDLDRLYGSIHAPPPYQKASGSDWYKGVANAIYRNISFIERYDPQYVVVLSGDQVCKQNYNDFLKLYKEKGAESSVAVMEVPWEDTSHFGFMMADGNNRIIELQEKPENPEPNLTSIGIYIFNWDIPRRYLIEDGADPNSEDDFDSNIIPNLLHDRREMYAYHFSGYWKDVGTISSFWEANMKVLDPEHSDISLFNENWKIYSRNSGTTRHRISGDALMENSMITNGCRINEQVGHFILFSGVEMGAGAQMEDVVVMGGTTVRADTVIKHCIAAENVVVGENVVAGAMPSGDERGVVVVGSGIEIGPDAKTDPSTMAKSSARDGKEQ